MNFLSTIGLYKNAIISIIILAVVSAYSVFLWRTATAVATNEYLREKLVLQQKVEAEKAQAQEIANVVGATIDQKLSQSRIDTTTTVKEIRREIDKNTFYYSCVNTPSVMQQLKDARDRSNKTISE